MRKLKDNEALWLIKTTRRASSGTDRREYFCSKCKTGALGYPFWELDLKASKFCPECGRYMINWQVAENAITNNDNIFGKKLTPALENLAIDLSKRMCKLAVARHKDYFRIDPAIQDKDENSLIISDIGAKKVCFRHIVGKGYITATFTAERHPNVYDSLAARFASIKFELRNGILTKESSTKLYEFLDYLCQ